MFTTVGSRAGRKRVLSTTASAAGLPLIGTGLTYAVSTPLLDLSETWNNGAVAFIGQRYNVTNTASLGTSRLFDYQIGGTSFFYNDSTDGTVTIHQLTAAVTGQTLTINAAAGVGAGQISFNGGASTVTWQNTGTAYFGIHSNINATFNWGGGTVLVGDETTRNFAIKNQTSSTGLRVYNTTDATFGGPVANYERLVLDWTTTANTGTIGTQAGGTGTGRDVHIVAPTGNFIQIGNASNQGIDIGTGSGGSGIVARFASTQLNLGPTNAMIAWSGTGTVTVGNDLALARNSASVLEINNSNFNTLTGTYMNWGGQRRVTTNFTSSTSTLTAITGISSAVLNAGRNYAFSAWLAVTGSSLAGVQIGITCSSTTITTLLSDGFMHDAGVMRGSSVGVISSTGTPVVAVSSATATSSNPSIRVNGMIRVASSGTFGLTVAQSTASATQTIVSSASYLIVYDMP